MPDLILECHDLYKSFAGVPVLRGVSLQVPAASIVGVVGENGAGKSTLMNLIGGVHTPDSGHMSIAGAPYQPRTPLDAQKHGIAFVHQELNLFPNLSIADNLFLSRPRQSRLLGFPVLDRAGMQAAASEVLQRIGLRHTPNTLVETLSPGDRQMIEIAKALQAQARLIILDEPTTSLTAPEVDRLFQLLRDLRQSGVSMLYISHALDHVLALCDHLVVLRDGQRITHGAARDFHEASLIQAMVGREVTQLFPPKDSRTTSGDVLLQVENVSEPGVAESISFTLHAGEILGIAGLMGAGRSELARILFGLDPSRSGRIELAGTEIQALSTAERIRCGLALVTESRREDGLFLDASVAENIQIVHGDKAEVQSLIQRLRIVCAGEQQPVSQLSGGNQQKAIIAKWLAVPPRVLILDEPTRGIDVGAKQEIYSLLAQLAAQGMGLLVISSEAEELLGLCDRILVMARGELRQQFQAAQATREDILRAAV